jgi:hypothetical protein
MSRITFVVEYEDGKEPPVHAAMDVAGGRLIAFSFKDEFAAQKKKSVIGYVDMFSVMSMQNGDQNYCLLRPAPKTMAYAEVYVGKSMAVPKPTSAEGYDHD